MTDLFVRTPPPVTIITKVAAPKGDTGAPGADGADGSDGASAYEIAGANGFTGTEAEWLDSLRGADGGDETAAEILAKIVTVDGSGSGLDADTLDGSHATAFDAAGSADAAVSAHAADSDPHTQYHTDARGDARYSQIGHTHAYDDLTGLPILGTAAAEDVSAFDVAGTAGAAVTAHESAIDPHPQYLTATEGAAAFDAAGAAASAVSSHAAVTAGVHGISAFGATLIDDADAATARATLGLGSSASTALSNLSSVAINTSLLPGVDDGAALGSTTKKWADLFLANGGVLDWNNGNVTLAHSPGLLTLSPGLEIKGNSATDLPTYSGELLTSAGWTVTSGWTESPDDTFDHTGGGGTTALTHSATITNGWKYQISWTVTGRTTGSFTITIGGESSGAQVATGTWGPTAGSTAAFTITPTTDFNGTISLTSLKRITAVSTPVFALNDSTGAVQFELRSGTALYNTFIGQGSGSYNTTGVYNTGVGYQALYNNTTGDYNAAQGYQALQKNTTGDYNAAQGYQALLYNTTGSYNAAQGIRALYNNTTGSSNAAQGYQALYANITGSYNIGIGYNAGRFQADGSTALTDPENSVYIGYGARGYSNADSNSIVIGYNAIGLGANTTVIGNSSTDTTVIFGSVGLGIASPDTALDVNGAITFRELSTTPNNPDNGSSVLWMEAATGDIKMKITSDGVTKTVTLVDFSAV